jgi:predicted outer membrane protein
MALSEALGRNAAEIRWTRRQNTITISIMSNGQSPAFLDQASIEPITEAEASKIAAELSNNKKIDELQQSYQRLTMTSLTVCCTD